MDGIIAEKECVAPFPPGKKENAYVFACHKKIIKKDKNLKNCN